MSIKLVLRQKPAKDGTLPLCLRITKDRKSSFVHLGYSIMESDWDAEQCRVKKSYPNSVRMNNLLLQRLAEATNGALDIETKTAHVSASAVKSKIKPKAGTTFFSQAQEFLDNLKSSGKYNQYASDKSRINCFKEFLKNSDIAFSDITVGFLERFTVYLKSKHTQSKQKKKPISERSVLNHLVVIRSVFAHARKNQLVEKNQSPFGEGGIKIKFPDSKKVGILPEDIEAMEQVHLPDPRHDHVRNLWLFSYYFAGMRVSDVLRLKWSDFHNNRLHYSMGKNDKGGSLKIPDKASKILEHYRQFKENKNDTVFPELRGIDLRDEFEAERIIAYKTSAIDKFLRLHVAPAAGIDKKITMHISRHTFGEMAGDTIPIQMLQKLYRHSNVATTIGYQSNFIHKDADEALDAVINRVKPTLK